MRNADLAFHRIPRGIRTIPEIFGRLSLRSKIVMAVVLIVMVSVLFSAVYFYVTISHVIELTAIDNLDLLLNETNESLTVALNTIDNTTKHLYSSHAIMELLENGIELSNDEFSIYKTKYDIENEMRYSMMFNDAWNQQLIDSAMLFLTDKQYVGISRDQFSHNSRSLDIYTQVAESFVPGLRLYPPSAQCH